MGETTHALPPVDEQHRIVAKVDELMALCDELETAQAKRENRRDRLVAATLHGLNNGDKDTENGQALPFAESARFYFNHLPKLTTRPEHIKQLRQTILNTIAIDQACGLPMNWIWVPLGLLTESINNGIYKPAGFFSETGVACVRMFNIQDGRLDMRRMKRLELASDEIEKYSLIPGDIVINRVNSRELAGKAAVVDTQPERLVFEAMNMRLRLTEKTVLPVFINMVFGTDSVRSLLRNQSKAASGQVSSQPQVTAVSIPLPPLEEQRRIIARVEDLTALTDELEAQLGNTQATYSRLIEAILSNALLQS